MNVKDIEKYIKEHNINAETIEKRPFLIDYVDSIGTKLTEEQKDALNLQARLIRKACKGRGIMIVDEKATRRHKRTIWKIDGI